MADRRNLSEWLKFLIEAGIPAGQAASYAVSFVENRIEKDMLGDLNKEYLKELGITVLGDVIAILKYAQKQTAQSVLSKSDLVKPESVSAKLLALKQKRIQTQRSSIIHSTPISKVVDLEEDVVYDDDDDDDVEEEPEVPIVEKRKILAARKRIVAPDSSSKPLKEVVPVPKSRRVLPEHEGPYKIKMPSGTAPKTARLASQGKLRPANVSSRGIFSRLNKTESDDPDIVTVETSKRISLVKALNKPSQDRKTAFTVTGLGKVDPNNILGKMRSDSPTVRLAPKALKRAATSTQDEDDDDSLSIASDAMSYKGVLKTSGSGVSVTKRIAIEPKRPKRSEPEKINLVVKKKSIKARLGASTATPTSILSSASQKNPSVKRRLGNPDDHTVSSTSDNRGLKGKLKLRQGSTQTITVGLAGSDVFSRLGHR